MFGEANETMVKFAAKSFTTLTIRCIFNYLKYKPNPYKAVCMASKDCLILQLDALSNLYLE
jgi:hypothetical protein